MDSSNAQHHHQEMSSQTLESMLVCTKAQQDKKPRPPEQALKCPRCDSTNTKFCYYNNYSLTQPRYFCKSCRRYWTKGGTLRNVPVGGGCRKNRRSSSSSSSSSSKKGQDPNPFQPNPNPLSSLTSMMPYDSDISLALARLQKHSMNGGGNLFDHDHHHQQPIDPNMMQNNPNHNQTGFFDSLRGSGFADGQNQNHQAFQNLYYGGGNNVNNMGHDQEMTSAMVGYESSYDREMSVKQEMSRPDAVNGNDGGSSKVLWGFPWQVNAGGDVSNGGDHHHNLDSGRQQMMMSSSWNNGFGASWQGLLNSAPLM